MKKIVIVGLLGGLIMLAIGMLTSPIFQALAPSLKTEYENPSLFRPWSDPLMSLYFVHPFLLSIILAWIWSRVRTIFMTESNTEKGLLFGLIVWVATSIPGMLMSYASFPISLPMILSWTTSGFLELIGLGFFFSKTLK
jgi:hypothetical protein